MTTVYVVYTADYDEWEIEGIWSTEELAKMHETLLGDEAGIDAYELDALQEVVERGLVPWWLYMAIDGSVKLEPQRQGLDAQSAATHARIIGRGTGSRLDCTCWAKTSEEATRITNIIRKEIVACGNWREGYVWEGTASS